jgi:hypothetical protein
MKQRRAPTIHTGTKVEPKSKAVSPEYVSEIGIKQFRTEGKQLYKGRGFEAPMVSRKTHKAGSQGQH